MVTQIHRRNKVRTSTRTQVTCHSCLLLQISRNDPPQLRSQFTRRIRPVGAAAGLGTIVTSSRIYTTYKDEYDKNSSQRDGIVEIAVAASFLVLDLAVSPVDTRSWSSCCAMNELQVVQMHGDVIFPLGPNHLHLSAQLYNCWKIKP